MNRKIAAMIGLVLVLLLGGTGYYFGFVNDESYISIRMWLAGKQTDKGRISSAEKLYSLVLERDDSHTEAYLALGQLYMEEERYEDAIGLWRRGAELTDGEKSICEALTGAYITHAEDLLTKEKADRAIEMLESAPEDRVPAEAVMDVLSRAYLAKAEQLKEAGQLESALTMLGSADPEKLDFSVFQDFRCRGFLEMGIAALEQEDMDSARQYFGLAAVIDPANEEARAALEALRPGTQEETGAFTVSGKVVADVTATAFAGVQITVPVTADFKIEYAGSDTQDEAMDMHLYLDAEMTAMGFSQSIYYELYYFADETGNSSYACSEKGGTWMRVQDGRSISRSSVSAMVQDYEAFAVAGQTNGMTAAAGNELCVIYKDHRSGRDYMSLFGNGSLPGMETLTPFLQGAEADVVRYISVFTEKPVRVEADLSGSDFTAAEEMIRDYAGGFSSDIKIGSCRVTFDITDVNSTTVTLPYDIENQALELRDFK